MNSDCNSEGACQGDGGSAWSTRRKVFATAIICFHVFAIFASPCASPPPSSYTWSWIAGRLDGKDGLLMPYLRAGYLNHGYRFFAPNPGPSHLVRFEIDLKSGGKLDGHFPNVEDDFPRLLYHRMFMISETAFNLAGPVSNPPAPGVLSETEQLEFDKQLATSDALAKSIARKLLAEHDGRQIRLYLRTHEIPFPTDVLAGQRLDDDRLFFEQAWREYSEEQL